MHRTNSATGADRALDAEIQNMELAFRMQTEAPDLMSIDGESDATRRLYGIGEPKTDDFGRACLLARRFAERGVRYITLMHSTRAFGNLWDQHKDLYEGHRNNAAAVDVPIAGLAARSQDAAACSTTRWSCAAANSAARPIFEYQNGTEGRLRNGRDHNPHGFTMWFAGGGIETRLLPRRHRRLRLLRRREHGHRLRPARDDPPHHGDRSHQAHVPPCGERLSADRCLWRGRHAGAGVIGTTPGRSELPVSNCPRPRPGPETCVKCLEMSHFVSFI